MSIPRVLLFSLMVMVLTVIAGAQAKSKYFCAEPNPQSLCTADNTCTGNTPCTVDIKRQGMSGVVATPGLPKAKANSLFCVKQGSAVTFQSSSKGTGFIVDFGPSSPFEPPDTIVGGSKKPVSVVAKRTGCFKYSAGACVSGSTYGMCGSGTAEAMVLP